jgi:catechol 2,3-dioxygenase-like lactoylglutathione lyase family enzyme
MPMLNHLSIGVSHLARSIAFYDAVFAPLGYRRVWTTSDAAGYGPDGAAEPFAIKEETEPRALGSSPRAHVALSAPSREAVQAFFEAALAHGGTERGCPGPRPHYGEGYFAAFVGDPDGYTIEAVALGTE